MPIDLEIPEQIGADRLVNAAYAKHRYGSPVVVVDFGTATSFDVVSRSGRFIGGAIAPGLELSASALSARAAQLPEFKLAAPKRAIGRNTLEALESGAIFCHAGGVDRLVSQIQSELEERPLVIATGGLLSHIKAYAASLDVVAPDLTLQGVRWITERNSPTNSHR
jgi:type III pantothenate kinase